MYNLIASSLLRSGDVTQRKLSILLFFFLIAATFTCAYRKSHLFRRREAVQVPQPQPIALLPPPVAKIRAERDQILQDVVGSESISKKGLIGLAKEYITTKCHYQYRGLRKDVPGEREVLMENVIRIEVEEFCRQTKRLDLETTRARVVVKCKEMYRVHAELVVQKYSSGSVRVAELRRTRW